MHDVAQEIDVESVAVANSSFSNNTAPDCGGGICSMDGTLTVDNSTFSGNHSVHGGGIASFFPW